MPALRATDAYIGFIDSDDYIDVNMYEELLAAISSYGRQYNHHCL